MATANGGVRIVRRQGMPAITKVSQGGEEHPLGLVKDFRRDAALQHFLPADLKTSFAWVHLERGEVLAAHVHPVESMIVVTRGEGEVFGSLSATIREGDSVLVPRGHAHGFRGAGEAGFWALSIQFEERGLYEDESDPLTAFAGRGTRGAERAAFESLLVRNEQYCAEFAKHPIFALARTGHFDSPKERARFLTRLQVWSDHFQRLLRLRSALSTHPAFTLMAEDHLREELGHNDQLGNDRHDSRLWDPVLESICSWFLWTTQSVSDQERTVLIHLVLEAAASVFYEEMLEWFRGDIAAEHFNAHVTCDEGHVGIGVTALGRCEALDFARLFEVQARGWDVMKAMFDRILCSLELTELIRPTGVRVDMDRCPEAATGQPK
jgi:quercetin dioxygenase-like cupin family protein